jgi:hypothetical protein
MLSRVWHFLVELLLIIITLVDPLNGQGTLCPTLAELPIALSAHRARQLATTRVIPDMAMLIGVAGVPMCSIIPRNADRDGTGTGRFRGRRVVVSHLGN